MNNADPISSTSARAICATTSVACIRPRLTPRANDPSADRVISPRSPRLRDVCRAGATPHNTPVTIAIPTVNTATRQSTPMAAASLTRGKPEKSADSTSRIVQ
jgi:hypothetical protein